MASKRFGHFVDRDVVESNCLAALARGRTDGVIVGLSAAALWGMPIPPSAAVAIEEGQVSLSRSDHDRAWRGRGVDGHALDLPMDHITTLGTLTLTRPGRTWFDCAAIVTADHLLAMGDWALHRGLLTGDELLVLLRWGIGRRGVVRARSVAPFVRRGVESPQESRLRWIVVSSGLQEPAINPEIVLPDMTVRRLDLAYEALRVGMEFDGDWHVHTQQHDERRRSELTELGWTILVARKDDLAHPDRFLREVRSAIADRKILGRRRW